MDFPRHPAVRHLACCALVLATGFAFWLNYGLVLAGFRKNQVSKSAPIDWRVDGIRIWGWHMKSRMEEYAKQNALFRIPFSELNMGFRKWAGMRLFPDADNTLRLNNGYLIIPMERFDGGKYSRQIIALRDFCLGQGIPFLCVVGPYKSDRFDDQLPRGMEDHCVEIVDHFVDDVTVAGVPVLDLRRRAQACFTNSYELFFRTDHHWKPQAGFWAASQIVGELNRQYGFGIPVSLLDSTNFDVKVFKKFFLGSLGKKVTRAYAQPDDFSLIAPKFRTSLQLIVPGKSIDRTGSFQEALIEGSLVQAPNYYRQDNYYAYLQGAYSQLVVTNLLRKDGQRILMVTDSSANVVIPFLSLVLQSVEAIDLRHFADPVYAHIEQQVPDAVVFLYASSSFRKNAPIWVKHPLPIPDTTKAGEICGKGFEPVNSTAPAE